MTLPALNAARRDSLDPEYRELHGPLLRFAEGLVGNRADAEEAVHDAFAAALGQDRIDDPRAWLFRVTRNAAISIIRRRRGLVGLELAGEAACGAPSPASRAELREDLGLLRDGLDRLSERGRTALLLRELAGLSYFDIARVLDVSEANVKVLIFRARRSLHELMDAVQAHCEDVQLTLSAAADGEQGRMSTARARLHALHCRGCGEFDAAIGRQRAGLAALVPVGMAGPGVKLAAVAHSAAGGKAGGVWGMKTLLAALAAGASLTAAGGVAVWQGGGLVGHPGHPAPPAHASPGPRAAGGGGGGPVPRGGAASRSGLGAAWFGEDTAGTGERGGETAGGGEGRRSERESGGGDTGGTGSSGDSQDSAETTSGGSFATSPTDSGSGGGENGGATTGGSEAGGDQASGGGSTGGSDGGGGSGDR